MNRKNVEIAHQRIKEFIHCTPVLQSSWMNEWLGAHVHFKCDQFQKSGSFKMRGALNAILSLSSEQQSAGVVTHSSGNFAQALSKAAQSIGVKAYIVMPENAPKVKVAAVKEYGGEVVFCEPSNEARQQMADEIQVLKGATFVHPSNDEDVIIGQGTAALEFMDQVPSLDVIFVPVGGGGLLGGTILASKNRCKVYAGEPTLVNDAYRSLKAGEILKNESTQTIADGLRTHLGDKNFPIILNGVEEIICVSETEILEAMKHVWERMKLIIEPSSAVAIAAVKKSRGLVDDTNVGIILSGGNIDVGSFFDELEKNSLK